MDVLSIGYVHPLMQMHLLHLGHRPGGRGHRRRDRPRHDGIAAGPAGPAAERRRWPICASMPIVIPLLCLSLWGGTILGVRLVGPFTANTDGAEGVPVPGAGGRVAAAAWTRGRSARRCGTSAALLFAVSGVTMALSAAGRFRNRVIGIAVLVFLLQFLVNVVGQLWDAVDVAAAIHGLLLLPAAAGRPGREVDGEPGGGVGRRADRGQCAGGVVRGRGGRVCSGPGDLHPPRPAGAAVSLSPVRLDEPRCNLQYGRLPRTQS